MDWRCGGGRVGGIIGKRGVEEGGVEKENGEEKGSGRGGRAGGSGGG